MTDPTTPAPTMPETMTEGDAEWLRLDQPYGSTVSMRHSIFRRILATYAALQAKTEECAHLLDLLRVADADAERVDKVCQIIAGHRDDYRRERDQARAALAEAQKDTARLDWLEGTGEHYCNRDRIDRWGPEWISFNSEEAIGENDPTGRHSAIRAAIDAASAGGANG